MYLAAIFIKRNQQSLILKNHYRPIRNYLPLYVEISPENASVLFSETGFVNTAVKSLLEVQKFQKNRYSFVQRLLEDTPIFRILAKKEQE